MLNASSAMDSTSSHSTFIGVLATLTRFLEVVHERQKGLL
jgi:hypothetical protein